MLGDWDTPPIFNKTILIVLAVIGLVYVFAQAKPAPAQISNWNGNPFSGASRVSGLSGEAQVGRGPLGGDAPWGNPLQSNRTVLTQGYGVGSHAPADVWGGIDLALDGDGDGQADPKGTQRAPVYATHSGIIELQADSWPAGNHIWVHGNQYKTGYGHLDGFAVQDGQQVQKGQLIGYVGSTGQSSGPHLHYHIWFNNVNVNPLEYGGLE
jgi:murein DD-endopeptidase MepM/ murein hydrolase activator NlpD